jgi:hypothetical protein
MLMDRWEHPTSDDDPFVQFILSQPGMTAALLREHRDDGHGHCAVCSTGGQAGRYVWPCNTAVAAHSAAQCLGETRCA